MLILGTAYAVFNSNPFQNWLTGKLSNYLSAQFKTKISIGHINYIPLQTFELENVLFGDHKEDTLFFAGKLNFKLAGLELDSTRFKLSDVKVADAYCHLKIYKDGSFNIDVLDNIRDPNDTLPSEGPPFVLYFDKVSLSNTRFRFVDETDSTQWEAFAANNEYFYNINAKAEHFIIINDSLHFNLKHLDLKEISGFEAKHIEAAVTISSNCMIFDSMQLKTPYTNAGNYFAMRYNGWESFSNFYDDVKMDISLTPSSVNMKDVAFFAAPFKAFPYHLKVQGKGKGTVSKLNLTNLDVRFGRTGLFRGEASLNGLPDIDNTFIDAEASQVLANKGDIEYLAQMPLDEMLTSLGTIEFKGRYTGFYKDFVAFGSFNTALGKAQTDINMKIADDVADYVYSGSLDLTDFNIGRLAGQPLLGRLSAVAEINGKGFDPESMVVNTQADIQYLEFKGYAYKQVSFNGGVDAKLITADLLIEDPNINLDFKGDINLRGERTRFNFDADISHANLLPLHLDTADLSVSAKADIDFSWKDIDNNHGVINVTNLSIVEKDELYEVKSIHISAVSEQEKRQLQIRSDNITADVRGNFRFMELGVAGQQALHNMLPTYFDKPSTSSVQPQQFTFEADIKTLYPFNRLYMPDIEVSKVKLKGAFNEQQQNWFAEGNLEEFIWGKVHLRRLAFKHNRETKEAALFTASCNRLLLNDTLLAKELSLNLVLKNQVADIKLMVNDSTSPLITNTNVAFTFRDKQIEGLFKESIWGYRDGNITIQEDSKLNYTGDALVFSNFVLSRNIDEQIRINGTYGIGTAHQLEAEVSKFHLDAINQFVPEMTIKTNGILNGNITLHTRNDNTIVGGDASIFALSLDGDTLGDFEMKSNYADNQNRLMALVKSLNGKLRNLEIGGYYDFNHKDDALNFSIRFDESDVTSFQPFVKEYIKLYTGNVQASGQLTGSLKYPEFVCNVDLMGVTLMVDYLRTIYSFSTTININEQQIKINPAEVRDIHDQKAILSGVINHRNFADFKTNLRLTDLNNFQLLNTGAKDNDLFYGTAYADGNLSLNGPINDLVLDAKFLARKGTVINIPLSSGYSDGTDGLIHFVSHDSAVGTGDYKRSGSLSGFAINCMLRATKDAEINIVMDEQQDDKIRGRGEGDVKLELTRSGQFNMYGEVEVNEGDYSFTAMNLFSKKFILKPGGKITWTGDPFTGQMNITGACYVRTSVADVVAAVTNEERETIKNLRVPVECLLYVKGGLLSPDIKFDMNINDISGSLPGSAVSELQNNLRMWRNENELMTQQIVSLMLFGRFAPTNLQNSTGPTNLSAGVNTTLSGFFSTQATNFIQRLIPGFDLNVDYHTGSETDKGRAIITGTKRVFDSRLEIQASYDPINTYQNFLTQYNISRDGSFKAKAFSRAQLDPIYNRNINTNGVGLYYRKEFDRFNDMFKRKSKTVNNFSQ